MTGYFSQLVHHTGLSVESGDGGSAVPGQAAAAHAADTQDAERAPAAPHVEEIVFTASAPATLDRGERPSGVVPPGPAPVAEIARGPIDNVGEPGHPVVADAGDARRPGTPGATIDIPPVTSWEESRVVIAEPPLAQPRAPQTERDRAVEPPAQVDQRPRAARPAPDTEPPIEVVADAFALASGARDEHREAPRRKATDEEPPPSKPAGEAGDAASDGQAEREVIVLNYLREVRAWVAAPPEVVDAELAHHGAADPRSADGDRFDVVQTIEVPAFSRRARPDALEVHDLNLSIGTISVVIEEPTPNVPAPLAAPPRPERAPERPASEPTRLSRYYLRSW